MAPSLINLLGQYTPVRDSVLRQLAIKDVISLSKTAKCFRNFTKIVEKTQFNINDALRPFFDPVAFRQLQAEHNVLIGTHFSHHFVSRAKFQDSRLLEALVVQKGEHAAALTAFLEQQGYGLDIDYSESAAMKLFSRTTDRGTPQGIEVQVSSWTPVRQVLNSFLTHNTVLISWNKAYCVYGYSTFIAKETFLLGHIGADPDIDLRNARADGYQISACSLIDQSFASRPSKMRLLGDRRIGDRRSWTVPLNTDNIQASSFPDYLIDHASFTLKLSSNSRSFSNYALETLVLETHSLKFQYVLPREEYISARFKEHTLIELRLLPYSQQPARINDIFQHYTGHQAQWYGVAFSEPNMGLIKDWVPSQNAGWVYHDDEMLEILKARYPELAVELKEKHSQCVVCSHGTKGKRGDTVVFETKRLRVDTGGV